MPDLASPISSLSPSFWTSRFANGITCLVSSVLLLGLLGTGSLAHAEDEAISTKYRAAVKDFLEATGSDAMGEQISRMMAEQTLSAIAASGAEVTEPMQAIVLDEARKAFGPTFGDLDTLAELHAPIYKKHLTRQEIEKLTAFYETPLGQKTTKVMPQIARETGMALQQESITRMSDFQQNVQERLAAAGIQIQP